MSKNILDFQGAENEESVITNLRPEFNRICYNPTRASIIHLLVKSKDLNYTSSVEEIATKLGKRHSVVIHHLEKLAEWKIINVVKSLKHGNKDRRSIWGLNLSYPNLVQNVYSHMMKNFFTVSDLEKMSGINKNTRKMLVSAGLIAVTFYVTSIAVQNCVYLF